MRYRQSLRRRITLSFVAFGALLSMVITAGVYYAVEDIEKAVVESGLESELEYFLSQPEKHTELNSQMSADIVRYYVTEKQKQLVPELVRDLPPGSHELEFEGQLFHVLIATTADGTVYLVRDATSFEQREIAIHIALITSVIAAILIALWLGSWLSGKVISPVSALAKQVAQLKPNANSSLRIATQYADDEVGQLAATFDTYLQQMEKFIKREQEFTADASHELRTPLAIISGAAELLMENPKLSERALEQVQRINRASERMAQMLEVLLMLARETSANPINNDEQCQAKEVVQEVIEQHSFLIENSPIQLHSEIIESFELPVSRTVLAIVLSNLLRNAINHTKQGEINIKVDKQRIEISDSGCGIETGALAHLFDRYYRGSHSKGNGIGLSIVKRICDRQGWRIDVESEVEKGTQIVLEFPHTDTTHSA